MVWTTVGLAAASLLLWKTTGDLARGAAIPIGVFAVLHFVVGASVFFRAGHQSRRLSAQLKHDPAQFLAAETQRMAQVQANFEKYKMAEQLLFFLGCGFLAGGAFLGGGDYMAGAGAGLCIQSAFTLVFDLFAAYRAGFYQYELDVFQR